MMASAFAVIRLQGMITAMQVTQWDRLTDAVRCSQSKEHKAGDTSQFSYCIIAHNVILYL